MTYSKEITFPANPTQADIKNLRRQVAKDQFEVIEGGRTENPASAGPATGPNQAEPEKD